MNRHAKKIISVFTMILILCVLAGCSRASMLTYEVNRDKNDFIEMLEAVFESIENEDKEGLKALFAVSSVEADPEFDNRVDEFFEKIKGPVEIEQLDPLLQTGGANYYGQRRITLNDSGSRLVIKAGGIRYRISMSMSSIDDFDKDNEGIHVLELVTEEAYNSPYFARRNSSDGTLFVQDSVEKRDDIMWVEGRPHSYTYYDRTLTVEEMISFVEKNDKFEFLASAIGEPNGTGSFEERYYEIGDKLYVVCKLGGDIPYDHLYIKNDKKDSVIAIYLADEENYIETVWMADEVARIDHNHRYIKHVDRELTEDFFVSFASRSQSVSELEEEIGGPTAGSTWRNYYELIDGRYVCCYYSGDSIDRIYITDSDDPDDPGDNSYTLWEAPDSEEVVDESSDPVQEAKSKLSDLVDGFKGLLPERS